VLLGQFLELQRQPRLLDVEGGAIGREFMAGEEEIEQPVLRFGWLREALDNEGSRSAPGLDLSLANILTADRP
jgi:hypothetical protein